MDYFLKADFGMGMSQVAPVGHTHGVTGRAKNLTEARKQAIKLLSKYVYIGEFGHGGRYEYLLAGNKVIITHFGKSVGYVQRRVAKDTKNPNMSHMMFTWHPVEGTYRGVYTDGSLKPIEKLSDNLFPKLMFPTI